MLSDFLSLWTDKTNGNFLLDAVPAGRYLLSVNPKNCPNQTTPESPRETNAEFGRMFFNGTENKSEAKIIEVKEGEEIKLGKFRLSPPLKERWFSGVVLSENKTPSANAVVFLMVKDFGECSVSGGVGETKTDEFGHFRLKGYESYEYKIRAYIQTNNQNSSRVFSKILELPTKGNAQNIELIVDSLY